MILRMELANVQFVEPEVYDRLLVVLELSVVIIFSIDLVLVFIGLLISLKGS